MLLQVELSYLATSCCYEGQPGLYTKSCVCVGWGLGRQAPRIERHFCSMGVQVKARGDFPKAPVKGRGLVVWQRGSSEAEKSGCWAGWWLGRLPIWFLSVIDRNWI